MQKLEDEFLIYDLIFNKAFCLNKTSAVVWQLCDGKKTISEISSELGDKLKSPANENLGWLALDQLKKQNLLVDAENLPEKFEGLSRREIIKRVGITSTVALPLILSLIAPAATSAASACLNSSGQALNTTVRTTPGGFAGCYDDCSATTVGARCCAGSARGTAIICDPGPP